MLVILARSARCMKLLPFSSDNARSGTRRGALAESSRASRTGREGFVAGFRKSYGGGGPSARGGERGKGGGRLGGGGGGGRGGGGNAKGPPALGKKYTPAGPGKRTPTS